MLITHYNQYFFGASLQSIWSNKPCGETKLTDKTLQALYFAANLRPKRSQKSNFHGNFGHEVQLAPEFAHLL
jgi:hypothetical protein